MLEVGKARTSQLFSILRCSPDLNKQCKHMQIIKSSKCLQASKDVPESHVVIFNNKAELEFMFEYRSGSSACHLRKDYKGQLEQGRCLNLFFFSLQVFLHCGSFSSAIDLNPSPGAQRAPFRHPLWEKNAPIFAENSTSARSNSTD